MLSNLVSQPAMAGGLAEVKSVVPNILSTESWSACIHESDKLGLVFLLLMNGDEGCLVLIADRLFPLQVLKKYTL